MRRASAAAATTLATTSSWWRATTPASCEGSSMPLPECPLCRAVKEGPCIDSFYPFEACLQRCDKSGEDAMTACNPPFMDMMGCMAQHQEAYEAIFSRMAKGARAMGGGGEGGGSKGGGGGGGGGGAPAAQVQRYKNAERAAAALQSSATAAPAR